MTAGVVLVGSLAGMALILSLWALAVLVQVRADQTMILQMLTWLWKRELKKEGKFLDEN